MRKCKAIYRILSPWLKVANNMKSIPQFFWIALSVAFLLAAGAVAYYFIDFLPNKETTKIQTQTQNQVIQDVQKRTEKQIREDCEKEGFDRAKNKLQSLIDSGLATGYQKTEYEKALKQGLALKEDIEYYRKLCLENEGL